MWHARTLLAAIGLSAVGVVSQDHENTQSPCYDAQGQSQRCQPVFMNAAFGRRVHATNTCGVSRPTNFCGLTDKVCDVCIDGDPYRQHPPSYLTDFNNFDNETWWQSDTMIDDIQYPNVVNLTLYLGKAFDITYVRLKFKSPRPESFAIYKKSSADADWVPYQYYSSSCRDTYGLPDLVYLPEDSEDRAICTSEFSDISPLTSGSVAFATLEGRPGALQFDYNRQLQDWVTATAIRISLNRLNTFGDEVFRDPRVLQSYYYAITDFAVGGTCKCNGHASNCVPSTSESGEERLVCQCQHNTAGADCQRCLPFYNDVPWQRATPDDASECKACNCNGYSNRCFFDQELYDLTGHGGHCTDCIANRAGVNCERCQENHYEREDGYCIPCACDPEGSRSLQCNINGKCSCKPGVGGDKCDRCESNFYDFSQQGCRECNCHMPGSLENQPSCDPVTGICRCKENVEGQMCDRCKPGFFSISEENKFGCTPCFCYGHSSICDTATGYSEVVPRAEFVRSDESWKAETYSGQPVAHAYRPLVQVIAVSSSSQEPVYFKAPDRFLGDQRSSYNQDMVFTLRIGEPGPAASVADVVLQGAGMEVSLPIFGQGNTMPDLQDQEYTFRLHEHSDYGWSPRLRARDFISLLSNITAIKIRATYTPEGVGFLQSFSLVSARRGIQGKEATWVETCTCPPGYVGQFCESCQPGFRHEPANGGAFARCVPCDCNGHADICDAESGKCICRDNTAGDNCELCARGFYGNALGGTTEDCKLCPCPGGGACIELYEGEVACLECPKGYAGHKCDICIDGWFGEPDNEKPCRECDCNGNVDPNAVGNCDRTTGECLKCIHDTDGFSCDSCLPGYFGDPLALPKGDCRTCACNPVGTLQLEGEPDGPYLCDQLSGQCTCKPFVTGDKCERCVNGYWNILSGEGCGECGCDPVGSYNASCDIASGQCFCREGVVGQRCDQCDVNMFGFSLNGCQHCDCDPIGSLELQCDASGQCPCRENVEGIRCDRCKENKYDRQAGCRDCPPCYTLVQDAVDAHRAKLEQLSALISNVTDNPSLPDDREFEERLQEVVITTRQLFESAQTATSGERSPLEILDDLEERLDKIKALAGTIVTHMEEARMVAVQGERNTSEAEQLLSRLEQAARDTKLFLERDGADALQRAIQQSKQFGIQSGRMSEIAREARGLADEHEAQAKNVTDTADYAVGNATLAYDLAYKVIEQQRNFSNDIQLLGNSLDSMGQLITQTREQAAEAQRDAVDADNAALKVYTEARSAIPDVDVDGLKRRAGELKAETQRLKADLDLLTAEHGPLLDQLEGDADSVSELLERGLTQQQQADQLMAEVDAARDKAMKAVTAGDKTLEEARETLKTLQGFDRSVQQSRELAREAILRVDDIARQIDEAERKTTDARAALQGAEANANDARDIAADAETMAVQAQQEATSIQSQSAETKALAARLREDAAQLNVDVTDTAANVAVYEGKLEADSKLAREAGEKVNEARSTAQQASDKVAAALDMLREIELALSAGGGRDIDSAELDELERRLELAEQDMEAAELPKRLDALRANREDQDRMKTDYEDQLRELRAEVANIQDIADALPTECYARVKLEP